MTLDDTQWPRFQVFKQDRPDLTFENAGSVHAPDAEMALQNARDVFVRRPECSGLWVVLTDEIHAGPAVAGEGFGEERQDTSRGTIEPYLAFQKREQRGTHVYRGTVEASNPTQALSLARSTLTEHDGPGLAWWVCAVRSVLRSDPLEAESMFTPARGKLYRQPSFYRTDSLMRAIKARKRREKGTPS